VLRGIVDLLARVLWLMLAIVLFGACLQDLPDLRVREGLAQLPDHDFETEGRALLARGDYADALLAVDAGLEFAATPEQSASLQALRQQIIDQRASWRTRILDAGRGVLTGRGDNVASLSGAVVSDLFVFGDVRDLSIQGANALQGETVDPVIVALSAAGLALTAAPELDIGASLLKAARKFGALSTRFVSATVRVARRALARGDSKPIVRMIDDAGELGRQAGVGPAMKILRKVDGPDDLAVAARVSRRPAGGYALANGDRAALDIARRGGLEGEAILWRAARKGGAGLRYAADHATALLRPHFVTGLLKGWVKGNVPSLIDPWLKAASPWLIGFTGAFLLWRLLRLLVWPWRPRRHKPIPRSAVMDL